MVHVEGSHCNGQKGDKNHHLKGRQTCGAAEDLVEGGVDHKGVVEGGGRREIVPYLDDCRAGTYRKFATC